MDYYNVDEIIKAAVRTGTDISPADRQEWKMFCCALKVLGYDLATFVALSSGATADSRKAWEAERSPGRYVPTEAAAKAKIIALAKAAGMDLSPYRLSAAARRSAPMSPERAFAGLDLAALDETPAAPAVTIDPADLARMEADAERSSLYNFLCRLFCPDDVRRVFRLYHVGATKEFNTAAPALASAFPYINAAGDCIDVHLMPYDSEGHRRKDCYNQNWLLAKRGQSDRRGSWPLFGEHLLGGSPTAPVGVVESEKTALIAALAAPDYVWVATASLSNLNVRRCAAVRRRAVYVFPDADGIDQWRQRSATMSGEGFNIFFCGGYVDAYKAAPKDDLGDILCSYYANAPERDASR